MVLVSATGCQTVIGAANGMQQDVHNIGDPDQNGWNAAKKLDAKMQDNLW